jgi:hypothetical protein
MVRSVVSPTADEEFRLKRISLDVDRAIWVVETALEWQEQKQTIPPQLLEQLSRDLFATALRSLASTGISCSILAFKSRALGAKSVRRRDPEGLRYGQ